MIITPVGPAPEGYTLAEYDHHYDCEHWQGTYTPCWVSPVTDLPDVKDTVRVIPIRKDGDWSGLFLYRPASCVRYPE